MEKNSARMTHFSPAVCASPSRVLSGFRDFRRTHRVAIDAQPWMSDRQFADAFAISQMSPGPNVLILTALLPVM
jgi:hypothetical protein